MVGIVLSAPRVEEVAVSTALYRRYRPETFAEVIGQEHVTEPLMVALEKNRVNHAYLFSGPRGCGKTTSARILARCLNCAQGPTPTPCGVCDSCRELSRDGGGSLDVIEMDAASHGGVDHARDLRERATLAPVRDRYKIFIIDEAHMVTREGFNALLKIVEEPPEHVKFIFATTEPNKVLGTIRSRTHHYPFRLVPPEVLLPFLQGLCDQEQVPVEPGVLQLVIRAGGGSVRDSLSILDQLMAGASSQNGIEYDRAVALLGYTHAQLLDEVIEALGAKDAPTLFGAVSRVVATGQDPRRFVEDLLERLRDLIVVKAVPQAAGQILQGVPQDQLERLAQQAQALGERELTVAAGTANETLNGMTGAANPQLQLELLCARLLLPAAEGSAGGAEVSALASRLQVLERRVASGAGSVSAGSAPAQGGMSAARAAGMAAAGLAPKALAPKTQAPSAPAQEAPAPQAGSEQVAPQQGGSQQASAGAPPLAGAPLATATPQSSGVPLSTAPLAQTAQTPATQAPVAPTGAPLAGNAPAAPNTPAAPIADAAPAATPSAPLKLDPNDPLAAVQGNWRAILNRMSVPGAAVQLMKVRPARMDGATLYVSADIATLRAVKGFVPELTARVSEFLRRRVTIHAQVAKPGEQVTPAAPAAQPTAPAVPAPQAPQQPVQQTPPQPTQPAPLADGPRGGEDAWRRHGQPLTGANTPESTSVDAPLGAWEVAPIPQSTPEGAPQPAAPPAPQAPVQEAPVQEVPAGPLAPEPPVAPVAQQVPAAPAGGFGERDSFAASGSGVPQQESAPELQHAPEPPFSQESPHVEEPPYEEEPPFEDEPPYAEPVAPAGPLAPPVAPAGPLAAAGPLAETPQAAPQDSAPPVEPAGPLAPAAPIAPAGPLATPPQAAPTDNAPVDNAPAREEKSEQPAAQTSTAPTTTAPGTPAQAARPARAASDEDYVSEDDEKVENSTFIGLRAIEKIIGGTVIDERPLHQP